MKKTTHYKGHRWTNSEIKELMQLWDDDVELGNIAIKLNSTSVAILKQVQRLRNNGVPLKRRRAGHDAGKQNKSWTQGEVEYLLRRRNEKATSEEIASDLGRTPNAVDVMIVNLRKEGVDIAMRGMGVRRLWNPEDLKSVCMNNQISHNF